MTKNGLAPEEANDRPPKRQKVAPSPSTTGLDATTSSSSATVTNDSVKMTGDEAQGVIKPMAIINTDDRERECSVGIVHIVNTTATGFSGVLKQRYTDFMVNEIALDGTVLHLQNDRPPKPPSTNGKGNSESRRNADEPKYGLDNDVVTKPEGVEIKAEPENSSSAPAGAKIKVESPLKDEHAHSQQVPAVKSEPAEAGDSAEIKKKDTNTTKSTANTPKPSFNISPEDESLLATYFGDAFKDDILQFHAKILAKPNAKPNVFGSILSPPCTDRVARGRMHGDIRRIFQSRLETQTVDPNIQISAASQAVAARHGNNAAPSQGGDHRGQRVNQAKGKLGWQELGGEYLHFNLYKENKDTMEVTSYLARVMRIKPKDFTFAGTKDRRAVTVQRVSIFRQHAKDLAKHNDFLRQARIGDFKYEKHPLKLGELNGNLFTIALRDCHFDGEDGLDANARFQLANEVVGNAVEQFEKHGFINYFGLQRFGTFGIGTDSIGKLILNNDFEGAVKAILTYNPDLLRDDPESHDRVGRDDIARARAIKLFEDTGHSRDALEQLPKKFSAETAIIRHLGIRNHKGDFIGALGMIHRNLKTMYVHAYQSLVWNMVASERWVRYGAKVIEGDLVIVNIRDAKVAVVKDEVDQNGEVVVHPADHDAAIHLDDMFERARPITAEEAESGKYSIFDIVLPSPGFDVEYPANDIGDYYKEFMGSERGGGLDPSNMRRRQKDFSLSGNYRKLMSQAKDLSFEVKWYQGDSEQLGETDLEILQKNHPKPNRSTQHQQRGGQPGGHNYPASFGHRGGHGESPRGQINNHSNGGRNRIYGDVRLEEAEFQKKAEQAALVEKQKAETEAKEATYATSLNAWNALPAKLEADQKAGLAAAQYRREHEPMTDASTIIQPEIKQTFIQTALDENGRRRVVSKQTLMVGMNGESREVTEADLKIDPPSQPSTSAPGIEGSANVESKISSAPSSSIHLDKPDHTMSPTSTESQGGVHLDAKLAVIVKFALGSSQYATMALRELLKAGGVKTYKPDYSSGR